MRSSRYNIWVYRPDDEFVFNGLSGALSRVPIGTKADLDRLDAGLTPRATAVDTLEDLVRSRVLIPDDLDEVALLEQRYIATADTDEELSLTIVTSLGCNFDCPYCFEDKHASVMSEAVQDAIVAMVDQRVGSLKSLSVCWFGGEPLVAKPVIWRLGGLLKDRCAEHGIAWSSSIITNGYLLDADTCVRLAALGVTSAQVSLDGPPSTHDRMRPLAGGRPSFEKIVANLHHAVDHLNISIRINTDRENAPLAEELLDRLEAEGLTDRLSVYMGQIVGGHHDATGPSATYHDPCLSNPEFAEVEVTFRKLAADFGVTTPTLPTPVGAPCTAVRLNDLVVGSEGELYKCWDSVGNPRQTIGSIFDLGASRVRKNRWTLYSPFDDEQCRTCIALPVCMGGCAHHAIDILQRDNKCGTFRTNHQATVSAVVDHQLAALSTDHSIASEPTAVA